MELFYLHNRVSIYIYICFFNSLWPSDAIWWHRTRWTLDQTVVACCLMAPSCYLLNSMLTNHQLGLVAFIWGQFHRKCLRYLSLIWLWKLPITIWPKTKWKFNWIWFTIEKSLIKWSLEYVEMEYKQTWRQMSRHCCVNCEVEILINVLKKLAYFETKFETMQYSGLSTTSLSHAFLIYGFLEPWTTYTKKNLRMIGLKMLCFCVCPCFDEIARGPWQLFIWHTLQSITTSQDSKNVRVE